MGAGCSTEPVQCKPSGWKIWRSDDNLCQSFLGQKKYEWRTIMAIAVEYLCDSVFDFWRSQQLFVLVTSPGFVRVLVLLPALPDWPACFHYRNWHFAAAINVEKIMHYASHDITRDNQFIPSYYTRDLILTATAQPGQEEQRWATIVRQAGKLYSMSYKGHTRFGKKISTDADRTSCQTPCWQLWLLYRLVHSFYDSMISGFL